MPRKNATSITFQTTAEEKEQLQAYCEAHQRSQTEILRELIRTLPNFSKDETSGYIVWAGDDMYFFDENRGYKMLKQIELPDGSFSSTHLWIDMKFTDFVGLPADPKNQPVKSSKKIWVHIEDEVVTKITRIEL